MACARLRPIINDKNGRITAPPLASLPKSSHPLRSRKLVIVKVEPSYISSDLFTPFSEPRSTLPSIAEFVRPSYGSGKTWGTATSSYGGVGPAYQVFNEQGRGSISRSHRHYGSGCINHCTFEDDPELGEPHGARKPAFEHGSATAKATPPKQSEISFIATKNAPLSVNTASALKDVCATLYGTSSYNKDFMSALSIPHGTSNSIQPILMQCEVTHSSTTLPTLRPREWNIQPTTKEKEFYEECDLHTEENYLPDSEGGQDEGYSCSCQDSNDEDSYDGSEEVTSNTTTHGHMICISDCTTILPSHVIVSSLSELPFHFRRVTTKYTRNRCPLLPCRVPHYLLRKHQLLSSVITTLPNKDFRHKSAATTKDTIDHHEGLGERSNGDAKGLPHLTITTNNQLLTENHRNSKSDQHNIHHHLEPLPRRAAKAVAQEMVVKDTTVLPQQQEVNGHCVRRHSHMTQLLGQRFKTEAHTRYHSLFPDHVPDLHTLEPAKRHTFLGYHTSVFRG